MKTEIKDRINAAIKSRKKSTKELENLLSDVYAYKYAKMDELLGNGNTGINFKIGAGEDISGPRQDVRLGDIVMPDRGILYGAPEDMICSASANEGIRLITAESVSNLRFNENSCLFLSAGSADKFLHYMAKGSDIIMAGSGNFRGASAILPVFYTGGVVSSECIKISADPSRCEAFFLNILLHYYYRTGILDKILDHSEKKSGIKLESLEQLSIKLPQIDVQKRIAGILLDISAEIVLIESKKAEMDPGLESDNNKKIK